MDVVAGGAPRLLQGAFRAPRKGKHDDKAHPPIHPVKLAQPQELQGNDRTVYEFVTRRYLACISDDARGDETVVEVELGGESFSASGVCTSLLPRQARHMPCPCSG
jgi:DNA topoisomerase III